MTSCLLTKTQHYNYYNEPIILSAYRLKPITRKVPTLVGSGLKRPVPLKTDQYLLTQITDAHALQPNITHKHSNTTHSISVLGHHSGIPGQNPEVCIKSGCHFSY